MRVELKPCPFCGYEKPKVWGNRKIHGFTKFDDRVERHSRYVKCPKCHARGGVTTGLILSPINFNYIPTWATTIETLNARAIENWNRRVCECTKNQET